MDELDLWLNKEEGNLLSDIAQLVEIESVSSQAEGKFPYGKNCGDALDRMLLMGEKYGFQTYNCDGYCGRISLGEADREIAVWGHIDVVPAGEGWEYEPFSCTRKGDFIIGRGVQDNKGPLVAVLYAMKYLKEKNLHLGAKISLIFGCNEEKGMDDVTYYLAHQKAPDWSIVADCSFPVCHGEKGICCVYLKSDRLGESILDLEGGSALNIVPSKARAIVRRIDTGETVCIEAEGVQGHAAYPEGTKNAIGVLCESLERLSIGPKEKRAAAFLKDICKDGYGYGFGITCEDEVSGALTCNPGVICLRDECIYIGVDIRYPITAKIDTILGKLKESAEKEGFKVIKAEDSPPYYMDLNHPLVVELMNAYREETRDEKKAYIMGGGTYARKLPNAVGFGPGFPIDLEEFGFSKGHGGCHSADEAQSISSLKKAVRIYVNALQRLNKRIISLQDMNGRSK